ncbi:hypothetical protein HPG69_006292 [Diceros bicornis minor]|uniref:Uncharacterized protein n=1 Tax=Diceros bicornis minor TaxID=77932 RepID=A0A7J7FNB3_DICBM|nr:hypothetical protein HPG69_006292 [Diceros bicornis minor]
MHINEQEGSSLLTSEDYTSSSHPSLPRSPLPPVKSSSCISPPRPRRPLPSFAFSFTASEGIRGALTTQILQVLKCITRGLTKEPALWTLVSKKPPAPANGTWDVGHDRGRMAGLSLSWAVPSVLVKDVPDFEQLSPELEAACHTPAASPSPGAAPPVDLAKKPRPACGA